MTLQSSFPLSISDINVELGRAAGAALSLTDPAVRELAGKPTGAISMSDLLGTSREIVVVAPNTAAAANVATLFNNHQSGLWAANQKKRLVVTGTRGPLVINSAPGWGLTIEVQSGASVNGVGGVAGTGGGGGAGGDGLTVTTATGIQLINNGAIRGGGGGGGRGGNGGTGGGGSYSTTYRQPTSGFHVPSPSYFWHFNAGTMGSPATQIIWAGTVVYQTTTYNPATSITVGGYTYLRGAFDNGYTYRVARTWTTTTNTNGGAGGAGGAGGRGGGIDQSAVNGSNGAAGSAGGANAGTGGTGGKGGNGGGYGVAGGAGSTGGTGANGNRTNGLAGAGGSSGGAAGRSIYGYNRVIYSGSGTLTGPTANT